MLSIESQRNSKNQTRSPPASEVLVTLAFRRSSSDPPRSIFAPRRAWPRVTVEALINVRDPRPIAPIRTETKELETQASFDGFIFKCYDTDVTVSNDGDFVPCLGP